MIGLKIMNLLKLCNILAYSSDLIKKDFNNQESDHTIKSHDDDIYQVEQIINRIQ